MTDTASFDFNALLKTMIRLQTQAVTPERGPHLECAWSREPGTGRMECHWVTDATRS